MNSIIYNLREDFFSKAIKIYYHIIKDILKKIYKKDKNIKRNNGITHL